MKFQMVVKDVGEGKPTWVESLPDNYVGEAQARHAATLVIGYFNDTRKAQEPERELVRVEAIIAKEPEAHKCPECDADCTCEAGQASDDVCDHECDDDDDEFTTFEDSVDEITHMKDDS